MDKRDIPAAILAVLLAVWLFTLIAAPNTIGGEGVIIDKGKDPASFGGTAYIVKITDNNRLIVITVTAEEYYSIYPGQVVDYFEDRDWVTGTRLRWRVEGQIIESVESLPEG